ncbi:YheU family protein [Thalassotalea sp. G2M2-11]|uniref:YheU family protein n=1 Tax=Thalassotalea sp. G2M2-11 TaxID=2787627 RepID=UPI0019D23411|nr:YheU family protein [Thalassotalea sp. G2M2-11]
MIIPYQSLTAETLNNIIEAFILREGTDYGEYDVSLDDKITQIKQQLEQKKIVLVFSELHQTVNILPAEQFNNQVLE